MKVPWLFAPVACAAIVMGTAAPSGCTLLFPIERAELSSSSSGDGGSNDASAGGVGRGGQPPGDGSTLLGDGATGTGCVTGADCAGTDADPGFCRSSDHTCVRLKSRECPLAYGKTRDPNALVFGAYALLPELAPESSTSVSDYVLAVDELNGAGALPDGHELTHPLVVVVCNKDSLLGPTEADSLDRSVDHLVDELEVPAIVADLVPAALTRAFNRVNSKGKKVFWLSPGPSTKAIIDLPDEGLVWSMLGSASDLAPAYQVLLERIEQRVKQPAADGGVATLRVAIVRAGDENEPAPELLGDLYVAITSTIKFNNQDVTANRMAGNYREFAIDDKTYPPRLASNDILTFEPHVIISLLGPRFTNYNAGSRMDNGVAASVELGLGPTFRPYYILNPINFAVRDDVGLMLLNFTSLHPDAYRRFLGINVARAEDRTLYTEYMDRLKRAFPSADPETENWYDTIYYLAYATYNAGADHRLNGAEIAAGMLRILSGPRYNVGPFDIGPIFQALGDHQSSIQLNGTLGPPSFNTTTGARIGRGALFCFDNLLFAHPQVEVYDGTTLAGNFDCYSPGF
jgi:hypothetical protein